MTGRNTRSPFVKAVRSMTKADIESLRQRSTRPAFLKLRDSHHKIARLAATGMRNNEIAEAIGYNYTRVSTIINSPATQELIAKYRLDVHESWRKSNDHVYETILEVEAKAWRKVADDLDDEDNPVSTLTALKAATEASNRTGHHSKSTKENININFAAQLEAAYTRSRRTRFIDGGEE